MGRLYGCIANENEMSQCKYWDCMWNKQVFGKILVSTKGKTQKNGQICRTFKISTFKKSTAVKFKTKANQDEKTFPTDEILKNHCS
jgi:hypothetical protein